ncbi:MAG: hypothetical protein ABIF87_12750 [Pseudomonadota bacterium]
MLAVQDIDLRCYGCSRFHVECEGTSPVDDDLACFTPSVDIVGEETIRDLECLKIA